MPTHLGPFTGQINQIEAGDTLPTTRENPEYIVGIGDGLDDGDMYLVTGSQILCIRISGAWKYIQFA